MVKMELKKITQFLDEELKIKDIKDKCLNGLQVQNSGNVKKIGFAVDACLNSFEKAKKQGCQLVITHHGLIWEGMGNITGIYFKRVKFLIENDLALYAVHLPLDLHAEYGNNIQLAKLLGIKDIEEFGDYTGIKIGFKGNFEKEIPVKELIMLIEEKLNTKCELLDFGKEKVKSLAIVSGTGDTSLQEAIDQEADAFLIGDRRYNTYQATKEGKINLIAAGHYHTETWGVKALIKVLKEKFGVETIFLEQDIKKS